MTIHHGRSDGGQLTSFGAFAGRGRVTGARWFVDDSITYLLLGGRYNFKFCLGSRQG